MAKRFSDQFKQEAVQFALANPSKSTQVVAKDLGVGYSTLERWLSMLQPPGHSKASLSAEQQRIRHLEREVAHLREVNEIIKKAHVSHRD